MPWQAAHEDSNSARPCATSEEGAARACRERGRRWRVALSAPRAATSASVPHSTAAAAISQLLMLPASALADAACPSPSCSVQRRGAAGGALRRASLRIATISASANIATPPPTHMITPASVLVGERRACEAPARAQIERISDAVAKVSSAPGTAITAIAPISQREACDRARRVRHRVGRDQQCAAGTASPTRSRRRARSAWTRLVAQRQLRYTPVRCVPSTTARTARTRTAGRVSSRTHRCAAALRERVPRAAVGMRSAPGAPARPRAAAQARASDQQQVLEPCAPTAALGVARRCPTSARAPARAGPQHERHQRATHGQPLTRAAMPQHVQQRRRNAARRAAPGPRPAPSSRASVGWLDAHARLPARAARGRARASRTSAADAERGHSRADQDQPQAEARARAAPAPARRPASPSQASRR